MFNAAKRDIGLAVSLAKLLEPILALIRVLYFLFPNYLVKFSQGKKRETRRLARKPILP